MFEFRLSEVSFPNLAGTDIPMPGEVFSSLTEGYPLASSHLILNQNDNQLLSFPFFTLVFVLKNSLLPVF